MTNVGIQEFKTHLSEYIQRVKQGESLTITKYGKSVAALVPAVSRSGLANAWRLVSEGKLEWRGGKPAGLIPRIPSRGKPASRMIIEERDDRTA